ncbi:lachesin [Hyalella azteca]|uniref:Lachesin n=2 Tax=Hyalella azteca TaxID=294128 RepID=A0A979FUH9_HYAAZ|nr:lachesin [Hyalella azteca]
MNFVPHLCMKLLLLHLLLSRPSPAHAAPDAASDHEEQPVFLESVKNVTVTLGRDASLTCIVDNLGAHKVAWIHLDRQMIVSIHKHVIARQPRFFVTHDSLRSWTLHVSGVTQEDRGNYMCQVNSNPMISQTGYLQVVVPPEITDEGSSPSSLVVKERDNVTLTCHAKGFPQPRISWRREDGRPLKSSQAPVNALQKDGDELRLTSVSRTHSGAYLCIASNSVPPSVSKRVMLEVEFPPQLHVPSQLVATPLGTEVQLECLVEAHPNPVTYWTRQQVMVSNTSRITTYNLQEGYKIRMYLVISDLQEEDFGMYLCIAKNSFAETNGSIKLYEVLRPTNRPSLQKQRLETRPGNGRKSKTSKEVGQEASNSNSDISEIINLTVGPLDRTNAVPGGSQWNDADRATYAPGVARGDYETGMGMRRGQEPESRRFGVTFEGEDDFSCACHSRLSQGLVAIGFTSLAIRILSFSA